MGGSGDRDPVGAAPERVLEQALEPGRTQPLLPGGEREEARGKPRQVACWRQARVWGLSGEALPPPPNLPRVGEKGEKKPRHRWTRPEIYGFQWTI